MTTLLVLLVAYLLFCLGLSFVFPKAEVAASKAWIPVVNFMEINRLNGRPKHHVAWLLVPIVNIFVFTGMCIDLVRSFGRYSFGESVLAVVVPPLMFWLISRDPQSRYLGPTVTNEAAYKEQLEEAKTSGHQAKYEKLLRENPYTKSVGREWVESIVFAVFAAAFIRMFFIEPYKIPTTSMEGTLLQGDFLFVSKAHYGMRLPQTIAMLPLLHNRIPFLNTESYFDWPNMGYNRLPALGSIKNMDQIVFNYPEGDSVYLYPGRTFSIHDIRRNPGLAREIKRMGLDLVTRPVDKRDHYVKRAVGIPGDSLRIINRQLYINGQKARNPENMQFRYIVSSTGPINDRALADIGINLSDGQKVQGRWILQLSEAEVEAIRQLSDQFTVEIDNPQHGSLYPHTPRTKTWSIDNYGPIWIPKKGATITLTPESLTEYRRVIEAYEGNEVEVRNGRMFLNGQESREYTFQMDYYFAIGDNRHNSEDSRVWGLIPEDHLVGKPLFIWFSTKHNNMMQNGVNWDRIFKSTTDL
ncbi:MAG: signal peptidase I [Bacteroidota bacterium]